ncbi:hypothetical protein S40293_11423 [Stachybotrys chartarum IBT 40293]|nr:hypothetical protein S40293_11423 [Stachybotrys chartarum IBT 40293]
MLDRGPDRWIWCALIYACNYTITQLNVQRDSSEPSFHINININNDNDNDNDNDNQVRHYGIAAFIRYLLRHLLTFARMSKYNEQFESSLELFRRRGKLLVIGNIPMRAVPAEFKNACRDELSRPGSATFFWPPKAPEPWNKNIGWVMLGLEVRADRHLAEKDLAHFTFGGRAITVKVASKVAVSA